MNKFVIFICILVVLPLLAQAGNIGKDDEEKDGDFKDSVKKDADKKDGDKKRRFYVKGDPPRNSREIFKIPENMTEEEWHQKRYEEFQANDYNNYQKHQFQEHERQRFQEWQMQRFRHAMAERQKELDKETERFIFKQKLQMKSEQEKHNKWLRSLLANEKERKKLLKQIRQRDRKESGEL